MGHSKTRNIQKLDNLVSGIQMVSSIELGFFNPTSVLNLDLMSFPDMHMLQRKKTVTIQQIKLLDKCGYIRLLSKT